MLMLKLIPAGQSYVRIPSSKRAAMRVILETVQRGSRYWTGGVVAPDKALGFADKMASRYGADMTQGQRAYAKQKERSNTTLVMYPEDGNARIRFWLLATPGSGVIHEQEQLLDAHGTRTALSWSDQYRLVHMQRPREHGGGRSWTWQMTAQRYAELEAAMKQHAAATGRAGARRDDLDALVRTILRMPGFYGIRQQQLELINLGRQVWCKTHASKDPYAWPEFVPYLDKSFSCYHAPEVLRLDVLVRVLLARHDMPAVLPSIDEVLDVEGGVKREPN